MQKAWNDVEEARQQLVISRRSIEQAEENLRLNRNYYKAGTSTMSNLLEAQLLYQQARDKHTDAQADYVKDVVRRLGDAGVRAEGDIRSDKVGYKVREHTVMRVPYMAVCGAREAESGKVAVRTRTGVDLGAMMVQDLIAMLKSDILSRTLACAADKPAAKPDEKSAEKSAEKPVQ